MSSYGDYIVFNPLKKNFKKLEKLLHIINVEAL